MAVLPLTPTPTPTAAVAAAVASTDSVAPVPARAAVVAGKGVRVHALLVGRDIRRKVVGGPSAAAATVAAAAAAAVAVVRLRQKRRLEERERLVAALGVESAVAVVLEARQGHEHLVYVCVLFAVTTAVSDEIDQEPKTTHASYEVDAHLLRHQVAVQKFRSCRNAYLVVGSNPQSCKNADLFEDGPRRRVFVPARLHEGRPRTAPRHRRPQALVRHSRDHLRGSADECG